MSSSFRSEQKALPRGIIVVAVLMIVFGLAELVTSFTHSFFGLTTSEALLSSVLGALLGACYMTAGMLLFWRKRWAATLAIVLLCVDVVGRIAMVLAGLYPLGSFRQAFAIVVGTALAAFFAIYIAVRRKSFA